MISAPIPPNEIARLKALGCCAVLDTPPEAAFDRITRWAARRFEAPITLISLIDRDRQWFKSCVGMEPAEVDRKIAFCAHAILSHETLIVPDTLEDARFCDNPQVTGAPFIRFYAGAPLVTSDGCCLGTLCVVDTKPRHFSPEQVADLAEFAATVMETLEARRTTAPLVAAMESLTSGVVIRDPGQSGAPIHGSLAVSSIRDVASTISRDISERRAANDALRVSEENHRVLFDNNPLPSWVFDAATLAFLEVNQAAVTHYGYTRAEFLAMTILDIRPPEGVPTLLAELSAARSEPVRLRHRRHRKKDGTLIEVEISGVEITFNGQTAHLVVANDVTERRRTEQALRESEARFSGAFAHSPIGAALVTPQGRWLRANAALCEMVGYSEAELLARTFQDITHPEDQEIGWEKMRQLVAGEIVTFQVEKRYLHADGHVLTVLVSVTLVRDEQGEPSHFVTQVQDIAKRKKAEKALLESKRFLRSTLDALSSRIAILDEQGVIVEVNQSWNHFATENGFATDRCGVGDNYLEACGAASEKLSEEALEMTAGIRAVMAGRRGTFDLEYPLQGAQGSKWFSVRVTRFEVDGSGRIVLSHDDITQRKLAEEELRWKTAFLEAQVHSSVDGIVVVDSRGKLLLQNQRCMDLWQLPEHLANNSVYQNEERLKWVAGMTSDPESFIKKLDHLRSRRDDTSHDEITRKDGTVLDLYTAPVLGPDGTHYGRIWTYRDITERKRIEESLRESEARYAQIAANVPGMVYQFVRRPDGGVALPFVSQGCLTLYGREPEEMQSNALEALDAIHPDDKEGHRQSIAVSAATLEPWNWQGRILRHRTGEVRYIQGAAKPTRKPNGDIVWDGLILDITDRKQAEEHLRAKEEAERTNKEKSKFLSRMSHELRTPLNAILGFGQVLEFSDLEEQDALALGYILKGGQHLLSLIDEVLDLSRAESGELHLTLGEVDAAEVAGECVGLVARLAEARRITCTIKNSHGPVALWCDEQRLRQMLLNLLSNAIKYNREGGQIFVSFERMPANRLRLTVADTGPGISAEGMARLFVPFERLEYESGEVEGTGLGLVVSQRIAEAMDGSIGVTSELGQGSTFWIDLPLTASQAGSPTHLARLVDPSISNPEMSMVIKVLYIEDNLSNLQVMQMLLGRCRPWWQFASARDGRKGLEQARQQPPDLILLDLQLPGISGGEVLDELRRDAATAHVPIIVLSADATAHSREQLMKRGADAYVSKPFQADALLSLLDDTLKKTGAIS